jgi:hypothetical protein
LPNRALKQIGRCLGRIACRRLGLARSRAEHGRDVGCEFLQRETAGREGADVAARARERHPRGGCRLAGIGQHQRLAVATGHGPVGARACEADAAVAAEIAVAVGDGDTHAVAMKTGQDGEGVGSLLRQRRCLMVAADDPVADQEVEQMRHLLEIGGDVGIVPPQVHVVELDMNDVLDGAAARTQLAPGLRRPGCQDQD